MYSGTTTHAVYRVVYVIEQPREIFVRIPKASPSSSVTCGRLIVQTNSTDYAVHGALGMENIVVYSRSAARLRKETATAELHRCMSARRLYGALAGQFVNVSIARSGTRCSRKSSMMTLIEKHWNTTTTMFIAVWNDMFSLNRACCCRTGRWQII